MSLNTSIKLFTAALLGSALTAGAAHAGAIISNGVVQLGVNNEGHLNFGGGTPSFSTGTTVVGLRDVATNYESTSNGCLCEGWGAGIGPAGVSGYANISSSPGIGGVTNLFVQSFASTASTATSVVNVGTSLQVTHASMPPP